MFIILEGPDGAGKSTLAEWLIQHYNLEYHHEGPPPQGVSCLVHYGGILHQAREHHQSVVYDRFALGERVYGPIYRKVDGLGPDGWRIMRRLLNASGVIQVLCLPAYQTCLKNWQMRRNLGEEMIAREAVFRQTFEAWLSFANQHHFVYDYENPKHLTHLIEVLDEVQPGFPSPIIGSPTASFLLVGDSGSDPDSPTTDLAFFGTSDSSAYLTRSLDMAGFKESELAFMNAIRHQPQPNIVNIPSFGATIIALGKVAGRICADQGITHREVPHPQYWRRFHHSHIDEYANLLKECRP